MRHSFVLKILPLQFLPLLFMLKNCIADVGWTSSGRQTRWLGFLQLSACLLISAFVLIGIITPIQPLRCQDLLTGVLDSPRDSCSKTQRNKRQAHQSKRKVPAKNAADTVAATRTGRNATVRKASSETEVRSPNQKSLSEWPDESEADQFPDLELETEKLDEFNSPGLQQQAVETISKPNNLTNKQSNKGSAPPHASAPVRIKTDSSRQLFKLSNYLPHSFSYNLRLRQKLESERGFKESEYLGSRQALRQNIHLQAPQLTAAVRIEKDEGELDLADGGGGFVSLRHGTSKLILGDYTIQHGLGLLFGPAFGLRRSTSFSASIARARQHARGLSSNLEAGFMRGAHLEHEFSLGGSSAVKQPSAPAEFPSGLTSRSKLRTSAPLPATLALGLFYSGTDQAANLKQDESDGGKYVSSLYANGLFRSENERAKRDQLHQTVLGLHARFSKSFFTVQLAGYLYKNSIKVKSQSATTLAGTEGQLISVAADLKHSSGRYATELMRDAAGHLAWTARWFKDFGTARTQVFTRYAAAELRSPFGANLGRKADVNNESGIFVSLRWKFAAGHQLSFYQDISTELRPSRGQAAPAAELANDVHYKYTSNPYTILCAYSRRESVAFSNASLRRDNSITTLNSGRTRHFLRLEVQSRPLKMAAWRLAVAGQHYQDPAKGVELSYYLRAAIKLRARSWWTLHADAVYFSSSSFRGALWTLSPAGIASYLPTALFATGWNVSLSSDIRIKQSWRLLTLWNLTRKHGAATIGSGWNLIEGNSVNRITFQLRYYVDLSALAG